jgi:L-threonylcarbamoyladenylate synthase
MPARLLKVRATDPEPDIIAEAAAILRAGGLVAFPTETVYGLGGHALDPAAVARIFAAKGRPSSNPLIVHVSDADAAHALTAAWPDLAAAAAAAFWPGPLTLVLPRRAIVPDAVTAGLDTVAVRVPSHPVARAILAAAGVPVAAPSANRFTRLSPTTAEHVARGLAERVDLIIDGGATPLGIESTVLDVSGDPPVLLRPGVIGLAELESALGAVRVRTDSVPDGQAAPAPGMLGRHYSPAARLRIYGDPAEAARRTAAAQAEGLRVGAVGHRNVIDAADHPIVLPAEPGAYARLLYAALHSLDDAGCDLILVEAVPEDGAWAAVADRLHRADAGQH